MQKDKDPNLDNVEEESSQQKPAPEDTGRRIDVSKVALKRNLHKPAGDHKQKPHKEKTTNGVHPKTPQLPVEMAKSTEPAAPEARKWERPEPKEFDDSGDFAALLLQSGPLERVSFSVGDKVKAKLIHLAKDNAFFSIGQRHEGVMPMAELLNETGHADLELGHVIDAFVVGISDSILLSRKVGRNMADLDLLEEAKRAHMPIEGKVESVNSGGYEIALAGTRGFCPLGQMDVNYIEDPKAMIGKSLLFWVTQISGNGRNVVLSRRALMAHEQAQKQKERLKQLQVGDQVEAVVSRLADFGAFADLGGIEGLIPMAEMGFSRIKSASDRVAVGDRVKVEITKIEPDPKREGRMRIGLSLKAAMADPFLLHLPELVAGRSIEGKVARLEDFGAFVELFDGVDGLIHISEMSEQRVRHPSEVLSIGHPVTVRILEVDPDKRRIGLSLRENVERHKEAAVSGSKLKRGDKIEGVIERIERYGVFLKCPNGETALMPAAESGVPKGSDLSRSFALGNTVSALVIDVDERGRVRVSKTAREQADERASFEQFTAGSASSKLGTLGDLFKKR